MIKILYSGQYQRNHTKLLLVLPGLRKEIDQRVSWFQKNPFDSRLRNHDLAKRMKDKWSFSVSKDIRIVYEWIGKNTVRLLAIGPHDEVYRRN